MKSGKRKSGSGAKAPAKRTKRAVPAATKRDARKAAAPSAPASLAKKAAEAIAPVAAVATAAPKAVEKLVTASAPTPASVEPVAAKLATQAAVLAFNPVAAVAPFASAFEAGAALDQARASYSRARENGEDVRQAVTDSTTATTRAFVELNGKVIDLVRAQSDATLDLWRSTSAGTFSEAIRVQNLMACARSTRRPRRSGRTSPRPPDALPPRPQSRSARPGLPDADRPSPPPMKKAVREGGLFFALASFA